MLAAIVGLGVAPGVAQAAIQANTSLGFPPSVRIGQTGVPASITLQNDNTGADIGTTNRVCSLGEAAPCFVPEQGILLTPSCKELSGHFCMTGDPGVFDVSATAIGRPGTSCAGLPFNVVTTNTFFGTLRFDPQPPGAHVFLPGAGTSCKIDFTFDVLKAPTGDALPATPGQQTAQTTEHTQVAQTGTQPGSTTFNSSGTTVARNKPAIATTATANGTLGGTIRDRATLASGVFNPTGTITFSAYGPGNGACTGTPAFTATATVSGNGDYGSGPFGPAAVGIYRWTASYSGDADNAPVSGACNDAGETSRVRDLPSLTTTATSTTLGHAIRDRATLLDGTNPTGTITFRAYRPGDDNCSGAVAFTSTVTVSGNGGYNSANFTPTAAGPYRWIASYSGDASNAPVSGACNDPQERSSVSP